MRVCGNSFCLLFWIAFESSGNPYCGSPTPTPPPVPLLPHPSSFSRFTSEHISKNLVFSGNNSTHPCHVAAFDPPTSAMPNQSTGKKAALLRLVGLSLLPPTLWSACSRNFWGVSCSKQGETNATHFFYLCLVIRLG